MTRTEQVLHVVHETVYRYQQPVERSEHLFRLRPVVDPLQDVHGFSLDVHPTGALETFEDVFGNHATRVRFEAPFTELRIRAASRVRIRAAAAPPPSSRERAFPPVWMPWQRQMMQAYLLPPELPETQLLELAEFASGFTRREGQDLERTLAAINAAIYDGFRYLPGSTTLETTPFDVFVMRRGVCQDFATLFICLARLLNLPARYRAGYVRTGGEHGPKIGSGASHAWAEVYLPWLGWRGYDPTNGCLAGVDHVRVAAGRDFRDATPTSGTLFKGGSNENLSVMVQVSAETSGRDRGP